MKVLIIEDDIQLNIALSEFFKIKSFDTVSVHDGINALDQIDSGYFDLYIIDINIPNINGLDVLKYIRKINLYTPIIIITASLEIQNFSNAFEYGCSEYIKKPFHFKELDIRINNLLSLQEHEIIPLGDEFHYNVTKEECLYKNKPLTLRNKEKRFCTIMMKHINTVVTNEMIYHYVWEGEIKESYPLRQLLVELRKKLPSGIIQTKFREGFMIESSK